MPLKTLAVLIGLVAGLVLAGCDRTPPPAESEAIAEPRPPTSPQADSGPDLQARMGLVRLEDEAWRVVHGYTARFYDGDLEALHARFSDEFRESFSLEMLGALREHVRREYGEEIQVIGEELQTQDEYRGFMRWAKFEKHDGVIEVLWILREDDSIAGIFVQPAKQPEP